MPHIPLPSWLSQRWHRFVLFLLVFAAAGISVSWVFVVPIFQAPDEDVHLDYALAIQTHKGSFFLPDHSRFELGFVHPYTHYLRERAATPYVTSHAEVKMPAGYGSRAFWKELDDDCPARDSIAIDGPPCLAWVYPFGYYALLGGWIEILFSIKNSLAFVFFGSRLFSVFLLMVSLLATFGTLRELRCGRGFSLLVTGIIGFLPLTSFVSSYIQPDNLSFTLVSLSYYLTLMARRRMDRAWLFGLLGLIFGGLVITKVHYFLCTLIPALAMLAIEGWYSGVRGGRGVKLVLLTLLPSFVAGWIYLQTVGSSVNAFSEPVVNDNKLVLIIEGFFKAIKDFFFGTTHKSFWGRFGWLDTCLVIGPSWFNQILRVCLLLGTWVIVFLTMLRIKQVLGVVNQMLRRGSRLQSLRLLVANPVLNSFFLFTAFMIYFHIRTGNSFGAQGRNWFPLLLPIFLTALRYAPKALSLRRRQILCTNVVGGFLIFYCLLGTWYAFPALQQRYYEPGQNHPMGESVFPAGVFCHLLETDTVQ